MGREVRAGAGATEGIEWVADPLFLSTDPQSPDYLRLSNASPALGKGSPYRIDVLAGYESDPNPYIMRRSIGAHSSHRQADYTRLLGTE